MAGPTIADIPWRGEKRKAPTHHGRGSKKARRTSSDEGTIYDRGAAQRWLISRVGSHSGESDNSFDENEGGDHSFSSTPRSPLSVKASPRFPSQLKTIACPHEDCDKTFNRPARLQEHLRSHTNTRIYKCEYEACDKDFLRETHLKHHIKSAHTDVREYICNWDSCGKSFVTNTRLKRHYLAHEGREKFKCSDCGQSFRKHATLQRHVTTAHEGKAAFVCEEPGDDGQQCGAGFDTAGKLKVHKGREHGSEQYRCTICEQAPSQDTEYSFGTYSDLQNHNQTVHPPTCASCGLACVSARELKRHAQTHHTDVIETKDLAERQTHVCPEPGCGRGFTKRSNLTIHLKTVHTDEKQFVCGTVDPVALNNVQGWDGIGACGRGFTAKATLEQHVRSAHLGLENSRKRERKERKKAPKATLVGAMTGTGYEEETRNISCMVPGCGFLFLREYDRDLHLRTRHGFGDVELQGIDMAPLTGDFMDMSVDGMHDPMVGQHVEHEPVVTQDNFWLGGYNQRPGDEWDAEEMEMRALIDDNDDDYDGNDGEDGMVIDPRLC
jgi:general transcription factor IIIA